MSTVAFATLPSRHRPAAMVSPALPLPERIREHLLVLAPLCLVPNAGTPADILVLALVFASLVGADSALASASPLARQWTLGTMLGAAFWLAAAPVLGIGAMITFGLFLVVRCVDRHVRATSWPARLGLGALATALVVDLSLVTLALERSIVWLALGAAIGAAVAAARMLGPRDAGPSALTDQHAATIDHPRALVEAALVTALVLVLALYAALLAHEPALVTPAIAGGFLTLPLVVLAVLRLAFLALSSERQRGVDPLAACLLGSWALAAATFFGPT